MTIKELEERLGMPRANIRFYEQEGLLSPARNPNGYRDYSEEDLRTLEKIKLLRELDMDLDTIRGLQSGEVILSQALKDRLAGMEADETALAGAKTVCAQLRGEWISYRDLDAGPWLERLEAAERQAALPPREEKPLPRDPFMHPWRRYFARKLDGGIYSLVIVGVLLLGFRVPVWDLTGSLVTLLLGWAGCGLMLLLEPLMLARWGTTPGKAVFGITVKAPDGQNYSVSQARKRTWLVFSQGMGYGIPFYELWRLYQSWKRCQNWEHNEWEWQGFRESEQMRIPSAGWRCGAYVGARAACYLLVVLMALQTFLPPRRTIRTEQDFYDNYNFYRGQVTNVARMDSNGYVTYSYTGIHGRAEEEWTVLRDETGEIVGVRCHMVGDGWALSDAGMWYGLAAYAGALPGTNCLNFRMGDWMSQLKTGVGNYETVHRGLRITQQTWYLKDGKPVEVITPMEEWGMVLDFTVERVGGTES